MVVGHGYGYSDGRDGYMSGVTIENNTFKNLYCALSIDISTQMWGMEGNPSHNLIIRGNNWTVNYSYAMHFDGINSGTVMTSN